MSGLGFQNDPRGWWFFIVDLNNNTNPQWPVAVPGIPFGHGGTGANPGTVVSATPPAGLLTPVGRKLLLRGILPITSNNASIQLRHGDGTTSYFDAKNIANSLNNTLTAFSTMNLAIPLFNGVSAFVTAVGAGSMMICYEPVDF